MSDFRERHEWRSIVLALEAWPSEALERVVAAPVDTWRPGRFCDEAECKCLHGHAEGWTKSDMECGIYRCSVRPAAINAFDNLTRYGLPLIVPAIQAEARRVLAEREGKA